jgi:hypothetical protein
LSEVTTTNVDSRRSPRVDRVEEPTDRRVEVSHGVAVRPRPGFPDAQAVAASGHMRLRVRNETEERARRRGVHERDHREQS